MYGYDFRDYLFSSLRRRIWYRVHAERLQTISGLMEKVFHDPECLQRLVADFSIQVTEMFRDPDFFKSFRDEVIPFLRELPFIRIWHAGCSSGEEVYSMAVLLQEEGLYEHALLYATDINEEAIQKAKSGCYYPKNLKNFIENYTQAGGAGSFADYYDIRDEQIIIKSKLKKNIVFAQHNLVTDSSFNEFHVIICRNVLIYFNRRLQNKVYSLFFESLCPSGFLVLGKKESLRFTAYANAFDELNSDQKLYRKLTRGDDGKNGKYYLNLDGG